MRYLLGLDNGGTFCKAAIFDEDGQQVAAASEPTEVLIAGEGRRERELDQLWISNVRVVRQALRQSGLAGEQIAGVSFSGHGKGLYLLDRDNRPLGRGIYPRIPGPGNMCRSGSWTVQLPEFMPGPGNPSWPASRLRY